MMMEAGPSAAEAMGITYEALLDWFASVRCHQAAR